MAARCLRRDEDRQTGVDAGGRGGALGGDLGGLAPTVQNRFFFMIRSVLVTPNCSTFDEKNLGNSELPFCITRNEIHVGGIRYYGTEMSFYASGPIQLIILKLR